MQHVISASAWFCALVPGVQRSYEQGLPLVLATCLERRGYLEERELWHERICSTRHKLHIAADEGASQRLVSTSPLSGVRCPTTGVLYASSGAAHPFSLLPRSVG